MSDTNLITCATREEWLAARAHGIGASEVAVVMGASEWESPYALWAKKAGVVDLSTEETEVQRFGHLMEPVVAAEYHRITGRKVVDLGRFTIRRHPILPYMFCTHDYLVECPERGLGPLSIKTAAFFKRHEWDDAQAPLAYEVQLQSELAAMGPSAKWGSFAVLIWGHGLKWFDRDRNENFIAVAEKKCGEFWERVQTGNAPPMSGGPLELEAAKAFYSAVESAKVAQLDGESDALTEELAEIRAQAKALESRERLIKAKMIAAIGDAEEAFTPSGLRWTHKIQKRPGHTTGPWEGRVLLPPRAKKSKGE